MKRLLLLITICISSVSFGQNCIPTSNNFNSYNLDCNSESLTFNLQPNANRMFCRNLKQNGIIDSDSLITIKSPGEYEVINANTGCEDTVICWASNSTPVLNLPEGYGFTDVIKVLYGTPVGNCGNMSISGCGGDVTNEIKEHFLGRTYVDGVAPNFSDPCVGTVKYIWFEAIASPCTIDTIRVDLCEDYCNTSINENNGVLYFSYDDSLAMDLDSLVESFTMTFNGGFNYNTQSFEQGASYYASVNGTWYTGGGSIHHKDAVYRYIDAIPERSLGFSWNNTNTGMSTNYIFPKDTIYNPSHIYEFEFLGRGISDNLKWMACCLGDDSGSLNWSIFKKNNYDQIKNVFWDSGETEDSIIISPTVSTTYYANIDYGILKCRDSIQIIVCTPDPITSQPTDVTVPLNGTGMFSTTTSVASPTYQWQMDNGTGYMDLTNAGQFSGVDTDMLTVSNVTLGQNNTLFRCIVTENSNCSDTTDVAVLTVEDNTGLEELNQQISIYPNPTSTSFTITSKNSINSSFKLMDIQGKVVLTGKIESTEETVDISKLSKGQYNLVFEDESISPISIIKN